ncbi:hypothetical protein PHMEG_00027650 [Phytophthora megakarya]|uniref:Uncharacterized protein n=1 Tax=Phytophthora megakarya TaxID=4795 RepID=A0A225V7U8_9STRA|nr:hypothetical protein PHMEG_00027650 [Phytophthora megakarya]
MLEFLYSTLQGDEVGSVFVKWLDRFMMYIAFSRGRGGEVSKKNTVMSDYHNIKNWLLEKCSQHRNAIEQRLLNPGATLHEATAGRAVTTASACTKASIRSLVDGIYFDNIRFTCPLHAIGMALAMQTYPVTSVSNLEHLAKDKESVDSAVVDTIPLTEELFQCKNDTSSASTTSEPASRHQSAAPIKRRTPCSRLQVHDLRKLAFQLTFRPICSGVG